MESPSASPPIFGSMSQRLVDALSDGVLVVDHDGTVRFASDVAHLQFGAVTPALLGTSVDALVPVTARRGHQGQRERFQVRPATLFGTARRQLFGQRIDGSVFPAHITLAPLETVEGPMMLTLVRTGAGSARVGDPGHVDEFVQTLFGLSLQLDAACADETHIDVGQLRTIADRLHELVRRFPQLL